MVTKGTLFTTACPARFGVTVSVTMASPDDERRDKERWMVGWRGVDQAFAKNGVARFSGEEQGGALQEGQHRAVATSTKNVSEHRYSSESQEPSNLIDEALRQANSRCTMYDGFRSPIGGHSLMKTFECYLEGKTDVLGWEVALAGLERGKPETPSNEFRDDQSSRKELAGDVGQRRSSAPSTEVDPETPPVTTKECSSSGSSPPPSGCLEVTATKMSASPTPSSPSVKKRKLSTLLQQVPGSSLVAGESTLETSPSVHEEVVREEAEGRSTTFLVPPFRSPARSPYATLSSRGSIVRHSPCGNGALRAPSRSVGVDIIADPLPECEEDGCLEQASFGLKGSGCVNRCPRHYTGRMTDLLIRRCSAKRCGRYPPVFGFPGQVGSWLVCEVSDRVGEFLE